MDDLKNNFLDLAKSRKTTYEFSSKTVTENNLNKILEAGRWSPSCSNNQPWHFVVVKNKETIKKLMMTANYGDFHRDPPLIIALALLKDKCLGENFSCHRGKETMIEDALLCIGSVAAHMTLEARDLGIDSCIVTPYQKDAKKILKIKEKDAVPLLIGFGYQNKDAFQKKRIRLPLSKIASYGYFGGKNR